MIIHVYYYRFRNTGLPVSAHYWQNSLGRERGECRLEFGWQLLGKGQQMVLGYMPIRPSEILKIVLFDISLLIGLNSLVFVLENITGKHISSVSQNFAWIHCSTGYIILVVSTLIECDCSREMSGQEPSLLL